MRIAVAPWIAATLLWAGAAWADTVELKNGDKLEGVILEETDEKTVLEHQVLGRIEIPAHEIKPPEEKKVPEGIFGTDILYGWHKSLSAGVNGATGKAHDFGMNVDLNLKRETERHRMQYVATFVRQRSDGETTDNFLDTRYIHDFLFPPTAWFPFVTAAYRIDSQQDWLHRLSGQAGVGYEFVKNDEWEVIGRVGGGVSQTLKDKRPRADDGSRGGPYPIRTEPNSLAALQLLWNYYEGQSLSATTLYLLDLSDVPNYRSESKAEWKIAVGIIEGFGFKVGTSFIYDSHEYGSLKRDHRYYANLVYDF